MKDPSTLSSPALSSFGGERNPASGRIAVFHGAGQPLELVNAALPPLQAGEILVRVLHCTLCRSDVNTHQGKRIEKTPTILGHEIVGEVVQAAQLDGLRDSTGRALAPGARITWAIYASDPKDPMSQRGMPQKAAGLFKYGHEQIREDSRWHGGLGEFCILRKGTPFFILSETTPLEVASLINCAGATAAGALRQAGDCSGLNVLVCGSGMLGLFALAMLDGRDTATLSAFDQSEERLRTAERFGARQTLTTLGGARETFDVIIDFTGASAVIEEALDCLKTGGRLVLIGSTHPDAPVPVDPERMVRRLLTLCGLHNYNASDLEAAVRFVEAHHSDYPFRELVEGGYTLQTVNEAFEASLNGPFRVGIQIGDPNE